MATTTTITMRSMSTDPVPGAAAAGPVVAATGNTAACPAGEIALAHLLRLVSPALPVGAYSHSQGMEAAVEAGHLPDGAAAEAWIGGLLRHGLARLDLPVLGRLADAWRDGEAQTVAHWNDFLLAARESAELEHEDTRMGGALRRLLAAQAIAGAERWPRSKPVSFATMFALAGRHWGIENVSLRLGLAYSWLENQVAAATKLVPLGQTEAQRILLALTPALEQACRDAAARADAEIGAALPGLAVLSARHEVQHVRLFSS